MALLVLLYQHGQRLRKPLPVLEIDEDLLYVFKTAQQSKNYREGASK